MLPKDKISLIIIIMSRVRCVWEINQVAAWVRTAGPPKASKAISLVVQHPPDIWILDVVFQISNDESYWFCYNAFFLFLFKKKKKRKNAFYWRIIVRKCSESSVKGTFSVVNWTRVVLPGGQNIAKLLIVFGKNRKNCGKHINIPAKAYH